MFKRKHKHLKNGIYNLSPPGSEPGILIAHPDACLSKISLIAYSSSTQIELDIQDASQINQYINKYPVIWINVAGLGDVSAISKIGEIFQLHKLALEDVVSTYQRAKVEEYDDYMFIVARMLVQASSLETARLETEQLSIFLGTNFVITFQELPDNDPFGMIRERLRKAQGKIRSAGADYLTYALLDSVIDHYYPALEEYGDRLDDLEEQVTVKLKQEAITKLHGIKRDLLNLRKAVWPLREAINSLLREGTTIVSADTRVFLRDCYDHVVTIIDLIETYRELGSSLTDVYLSSVSNRMNEVMKVLTVISTVFLPPTLIAGIYGMNFGSTPSPYNMPELKWYFGYPYALLLMFCLTMITLFIFARIGWLGKK